MNTKLFRRVVGSLLAGSLPMVSLGGSLGCDCRPGNKFSVVESYELPSPVGTADLGVMDGGLEDGGATDGGSVDGGPGSSSALLLHLMQQCSELCAAKAQSSGRLSNRYMLGRGPFGQYSCDCTFPVSSGPQCYFSTGAMEGRRPAGFTPVQFPGRRTLGRFFARALQCEAASVSAFQILAQELRVHRAPPALVHAALRAAVEEVGHARLTHTLLARFGGRACWPQIESREPRSLLEVAVENEIEGCVGEAYSAFVAAWQTRAAADPWVRTVMAVIAPEEVGHAELAFAISRWARRRLGRRVQEQLQEARAEALSRLHAAVRTPHAPAVTRVAGLPSPTSAQTFLSAAAQRAYTESAPL